MVRGLTPPGSPILSDNVKPGDTIMWDGINSVFEFLSKIDAFVGVAGAVLAGLAWRKTRQLRGDVLRQQQLEEAPVSLILKAADGRELTLPYHPRRDQLSRAELAGILGIYAGLDAKRPRFDLPRLRILFESGEFDRMLEGHTDQIHIPCPNSEFDAFEQCLKDQSGEAEAPPPAAVAPPAMSP